MVYDKGDKARCRVEFRDEDNNDALVDPTAVSFKSLTSASVLTTYVYGTNAQLVREATGRYYVDIDLNAAGTWYFRFESTGTYQAAGEGAMIVTAGAF